MVTYLPTNVREPTYDVVKSAILNAKIITHLDPIKLYLHVRALDYTTVAMSWKVAPIKPLSHTSYVAVVTQTDRPKSVRNHCVIELLVALFVMSLCPFWVYLGPSSIHSTSLEMSEVSSETDLLLKSVPQQADAAIFCRCFKVMRSRILCLQT